MITATPSGDGWLVEGQRYKALVAKSGITQLYLKESSAPQTNVLYGGGIVFNAGYGQTSGDVSLANADSSAALAEANCVRAVVTVDGFYEPGSGGAKYGTGQARLIFYADRFAIESVSEFTASLGNYMRLRPLTANFARGATRGDYYYDADGAGALAQDAFSGAWAPVVSGVSGPLTLATVHGQSGEPGALVTAVVLNGEGLSTVDLWKTLDGSGEPEYEAYAVQKTGAAVGVRYRAVSVFSFAATADVEDPDTSPAVAYRDDIIHPDPLTGAPSAGVILTGGKVTGHPGDEDSDGWCERETAYVIHPAAGCADVRFDDRRGAAAATAFARPVVKIINWVSEKKPQVYRWSGAAWQLAAELVDYVTTSHADEGGVGQNTRVVQILSSLSGEGDSGPRFRFLQGWEQPASESDWSLEIAGEPVDMQSTKASLARLADSWRFGRMLEFAQTLPHTDASWHEGQTAELFYSGDRVFSGDIVQRNLVGLPGDEQVVYVCLGPRARAEKVNVTDPLTLRPRVVFNAPPDDVDHLDSQSGLTVGGIIEWLFGTYADALGAAGVGEEGEALYEEDDLASLDAVPPKIVLEGLHFDGALRAVLQYEPEVTISVDPVTGKYRFSRLGSLAPRDVTYNSNDKTLASLVTPTLAGRYTAYRIVGRPQETARTAYLSEGALEEYWGGRAVLQQNVSPGTSVVMPVDTTLFFAVGDSISVGTGAGGETTTITAIEGNTIIKANLVKSHAAGSVISNKTYLEDHWTLSKAFDAGDSDSGTATSGQGDRLVDTTKSWAADRWIGAEVTLVQASLTQKRTIVDSSTNTLYVSPNWWIPPAVGDAYQVRRGFSRYRYVFSRYRVSDESKRRISQTLSDPASLAPMPGLALESYRPRVWRKFPEGAWLIQPVVFEYADGIFTTAMPAVTGDTSVEGGAVGASDMRLDYAYLASPCQARYPATGFTGTAYTLAGFENEAVRYEDSFAVDADTAQYEALAAKLLWPLKDVAYRGTVSLRAADPSWLSLDYRLNIKAKDDSGGEVPTGLESIGALVWGAEIDFAGGQTRLALADAQALAARGDWFRTLSETLLVYGEGGTDAGGGSGAGADISTVTDTFVTVNEITEAFAGAVINFDGGGSGGGSGGVTSVTAGGSNGIIQVSPTTGDVVVSHANYSSGNKTPCNYAPRWQ